MRKELREAIANLVRHYERLHIDHFHLLGLALKAQQTGELPDSIIAEVRMLRDLPESKERIEQTEKMLADIFQKADEDTLTQLLTEIVKKEEPRSN
jgi:hypothetical protein